jgi:S1-C subfamily serine protease
MRRIGVLSLTAVALGATACGGGEEPPKPPGPAKPVALTVPQLIERAKPAVVQVSGRVGDEQYTGTGFFIDAEQGLVATNEHVVSGATGIRVRLASGERVTAKVHAASQCDDVALLKLTRVPATAKALPMGDSARVKPGAKVVAMGFPSTIKRYGAPSMSSTQGTVTNTELTDVVIDPTLPRYQSLVQSDAAINPGNSGGPLLNEQGQVVAMATLANTIQNGRIIQGEGYGITAAHINALLPELRTGEMESVGWSLMPVRHAAIRDLIASRYDIPRSVANILARWVREEGGMLVVDVEPGQAADRAGIKPGDWLKRIGDTRVNSQTRTCEILATEAGGAMRVKGYRLASANSWSALLNQNEFNRTVKVPE